ncbi:tail length tape-measure protein 1 [Escherichia phage vB_EcoS_PHB17]|uniref:Tape measure protein n=1 Tax=Escherichia phage vB_EcoS_PHB17 TaxID=2591407 RepID=A0A514DKQ2_9CAUD|nr:tail length tape measure protein [Escherichia phage vB_EcoS_PHB17]QDH94247.1 tail length tape-measure protein 1 [Escherichia phage vB_EcoS_PHB17]
MAEQYAGISLGVDVSQVNNAVKSLQQFKQANHDAAKSVEGFVDQEQVAKQRSKELAQELAKQRKEFQNIQNAIDPTAAKMDRLRQASKQLDSLWKKGIVPDKDFFQLGEILEAQESKLQRNRKALTEEGRAALEESKQKARAAAEAQKFIAALEAQAAAAGKTQAELTEMKAAQLGVSAQAAPFIAQMRAQEKEVEKLGISMGQYRQAMRMLPAQITDVATSLAGGMPIWLVAIQQGGQIKDSFGGLVPMFKALATFITPFNVGLAALVGTLGYLTYNAYSSKKALDEVSKTVQDATGLSGEFAEKISLGVQALADASGKSADEIAKAYISTKDGAQEAIEKLVNVGFSYDEAREKVEQYKNASSFVTLNNEIADHMNKVLELGDSWFEVLKKKKEYISPTGGGGGSLADKELGHVNKALVFAKQTHADIAKIVKDSNVDFAKRAGEIDKTNLSLNRLRAAQEALNKAIEDEKYVAQSSDKELKKKAAENVALRRKELEELQKLEQKKGKTKTQGGITKSPTEQLDKELYVLKAQLETLKEHRTVNDVISRQRQALWSVEKQIQILQEAQSKRGLTAAEKKLLAEQQSVLELSKQKAELGDQILIQERKNKLEQNSVDFIRETTAAIEELNLKQQGMTDQQIQRELELQKIRSDYLAKGGSVDDTALQDMIAKRKEYFEMEDQLQGNWLAGAKKAFADYGQEATNMYANVNEVATAGLNGLSSLMTDFLTTGKASFKDFASSIIKMIVQMIAKMAIFNAISGAMGGKTFSFSGLAKGYAGGGYTGDGGKYDPAGVVHKGEFVFTKEATQRIGAKNLYRLMRGYANGGSVGGSAQTRGASVGSVGSQFNFGDIMVDVNNGNDPRGMETGIKMIFTEMIQRACSQGGEVYNFVNSKRG